MLKQLDERGRAQELVSQHYSGRYPFELLQNANDAAAETEVRGRARFVLTDSALIVADSGSGFGAEQIKAICTLGRSSKDPRKSVGYKGLGFKSVNEITDRPQVFSGGVAFEFDGRRTTERVAALAGPLDIAQRLPVYAFPFPVDTSGIGPDAEVVREAMAEGYNTLLRLPLKSGIARDAVEQHLVGSLLPRLLLFLSGIEELELAGTTRDFVAVASREDHGDLEEVLLETDGLLEHWLRYRKWVETERSLVEPLGDAWAAVERVGVSIAVPLDAEGNPTHERIFPLHVYFPTEEATGLPIVIHGDFALRLDRRQLANSPEAAPYNKRLIEEAAEFLAATVAPDLAARFPDSAASAMAVAPRASPTGLGAQCVERCAAALRTSRFLPTVGGRAGAPAEVLLLPRGIGDSVAAHRHLAAERQGRLVAAAVEADSVVGTFLREKLEVEVWPLAESLAQIRTPPQEDLAEFYGFLVDWADNVGVRRFAPALGSARCVHTATGNWVAPEEERVFFPRKRDDVDIPADLPVPIVEVPTVDGLEALLSEAGVRAFEWRELLNDYLLPELSAYDIDPALRERALRGLRAYYDSQTSGDPSLRRRIGQVLLEAMPASGKGTTLKPASEIYFPEAWSGTDALERIYGPFGETEFLAAEPPGDSELQDEERAFLQWIGVASHPRILEASTEQRNAYMTSNLARHPHYRMLGKHWNSWWRDERVQAASSCDQGHPASQQLRCSYALDRFVELAADSDPRRLKALWTELARNWGQVYERAMNASFWCSNSGHRGERRRKSPSLFSYLLAETRWVPTLLAAEVVLVRPPDAWRPALDTPRWVTSRVAVLAPSMSEGPGAALAAALEITDAARPSPADLVGLLEDLRDEHESAVENPGDVDKAAKWAMRTLNDVLVGAETEEIGPVPLLASYAGEHVFTEDPVVAFDHLLRDSWEGHLPILDADKDLRRLHEALGLTVLDDPETGVTVTPLPGGIDESIQAAIVEALVAVKPYLAALAIASTPSREANVKRGLERLEVLACSDLVLRYSFRGKTIDRTEATSFIAERFERGVGAVRKKIGTAHLEVTQPDAHPDWYSFGPQLANYLEVRTQGDAFAMVLAAGEEERRRYLASRHISMEVVQSMATELNQPVEDELPESWLEAVEGGDTPMGATSDSIDLGDSADQDTEPTRPNEESAVGDETKPLPELNPDGIVIFDVEAEEITTKEDRLSSNGGVGPSGPIDHEGTERRQREIGRQGEEAAFTAERRRVEAFGGDPNAVVWRSRRNPLAPHDIESLDEDGQRIYIEVKATTGEDPAAAFPISRAELKQALTYGSRFYIYRVTSVADTATPPIYKYPDPARLLVEGKADFSMSGASMRLGGLPRRQ